MLDTTEFVPDPPIRCRDFRIGAIGAGFIMADVHLASYKQAGFPVVAIASRTPAHAKTVADRWGISKVHASPKALIEDPDVEIVDIAFPPDQQPDLIRHALRQKHVKAILAQKPLALDFATAKALAAEARSAGKILSVNQNMRFDQSMRVLKQILDRERSGDARFSPPSRCGRFRIGSRSSPTYDRLTLLNMSIHHLDVLRFLLGDPTEVMTMVRHGSAHDLLRIATASASRRCAFPSGAIAVTHGGRMERPARGGLRSPTSTSNGASRAPTASPTAPSAGRTIRPAARARCAIAAARPAANGRTRAGRRMWFPRRVQRRDGTAAIRAQDRHRAGAQRRRQRQDHGACRSGLSLDRREANGLAIGIRHLRQAHGGNNHDAGRHIHRLLPLRPEGDGGENPQAQFQYRTARSELQGHGSHDRGPSPRTNAARSAIPFASIICRFAAFPATPTSSIRTRTSASAGSTTSRRSSAMRAISAAPM